MSNYIETTLTKGESIIYTAKISKWSLFPYFLLGLILLGFYGVGMLFWILACIKYFTTELAITNKRVIAKTGFISRNTIEIQINKIESIRVIQGVLGRIFNFGSIIVAGAGNPQAPISGISNPLEFRKNFIQTQETAEEFLNSVSGY